MTTPFDDIGISDFDPTWADCFEEERQRLLGLPDCPFVELEHIGSTSVEGLAAKPVIDMMASVQRLADTGEIASPLALLGYRPLDGGFRFRRSFTRTSPGNPKGFNLHVVTCDAWATKDERLFRDWLRKNPAVADRYANTKRKIALSQPKSLKAYTNAKSEFVRLVVNEARKANGMPHRTDWTE